MSHRSIFGLMLILIVAGASSCGGEGGGSTTPVTGGDPAPGEPTCALKDMNMLPFNATLESDHIAIATSGGVLKTVFTPWGVHAPVLTGHAGGKADSNWQGFFALNYSELTYLSGGDGSAPCNAGDTCGIAQADLEARIPNYIAKIDGLRVTSVKLNNRSGSDYYETPDHWITHATACGGRYTLTFGHTRRIAAGLRNKMIAAGYIDPWTCNDNNACVGQQLITGAPIALSAGDTISQPQVIMAAVPGHDGYFRGPTYMPASPHAQIEFSITDFASYPTIPSWYASLSSTIQNQLETILHTEAARPESWYYNKNSDFLFAWGAEMKLYNLPSTNDTDYTDILASMGSWGEVDDVDNTTCEQTWSTECDDYFVVFPIQKSTPFYDPANYESANTSYIAFKYKKGGPPEMWGEVVSPASLHSTQDQMLIKWRWDVGTSTTGPAPINKFQGAKFLLDPAGKMLRIRWTAEYNTESEANAALALLAALTTGTECTGTDAEGAVKCYKHGHQRSGAWPGI